MYSLKVVICSSFCGSDHDQDCWLQASSHKMKGGLTRGGLTLLRPPLFMVQDPLDAKWQLENHSCRIKHATLGHGVRIQTSLQYSPISKVQYLSDAAPVPLKKPALLTEIKTSGAYCLLVIIGTCSTVDLQVLMLLDKLYPTLCQQNRRK